MSRKSDFLIPESEAVKGEMGQLYLAAGKQVSLRLWDEQPTDGNKPVTCRTYEVAGYVLEGCAILTIENQSVELRAGDSWTVPAGKEHTYEIVERFRAIEATSPPARAGRLDCDEHDTGVP